MQEIDPIITSVEQIYRAVTGSKVPESSEGSYAPIPVERDPGEYVSEQLERLVQALQQPAQPTMPPWTPPLTLWESEREIVLSIDLPGVRSQDVELTIEADFLTVRGRRQSTQNGAKLRMTERPLGPFERRILLPPRVDRSEPNAQLRDGVLEVRLAKLDTEQGGRREIRLS